MPRTLICQCVAALLAFAPALYGQVPHLLHYQGRVIVNPTNFEGTGQFKFALIGTNAGGTVTYWSNDGSSVNGTEPSSAVAIPVTKGLYSVLMGETRLPNMGAIPPGIFTNSDVRLRVWFNDGNHGFQQFSPDQRIAPVGYALMAASVEDGAITAAKLAPGAIAQALGVGELATTSMAPGAPGQVFMTDASGKAGWLPASSIATASSQDDGTILAVDPVANTVQLEIGGLMTNSVVVVRGPGVDMGTYITDVSWTGTNRWYREAPDEVAEHSRFIFEYSGNAATALAADYATAPRTNRNLAFSIKDAKGAVKCRWNLPGMELVGIQPGSNGRSRYTYRPKYPFGDNANLSYTRTPESPSQRYDLRLGVDNQVIEIEGIAQLPPEAVKVDAIKQTITLTANAGDCGSFYTWFKDTVYNAGNPAMTPRKAASLVQFDSNTNEVYRVNYFEMFPISHQLISGFSRYETLSERIVIKYWIRRRG